MTELQRTVLQAVRFLIVSGISLAIDYSVYLGLSQVAGIDGSWSKRISFACIAIWGFFAHKYFTFRDRDLNPAEPLKFAGLYFTGWLLNTLVHDASMVGNQASSPAFLAATFAWACWNFIGQKYFVFRRAENGNSRERV